MICRHLRIKMGSTCVANQYKFKQVIIIILYHCANSSVEADWRVWVSEVNFIMV